jgi:hypothetical protein
MKNEHCYSNFDCQEFYLLLLLAPLLQPVVPFIKQYSAIHSLILIY